jgi:hypothetical protein
LNALKEDHADLQDKYDALSHTTSQKLANQAAELTAHERRVESLTTEVHEAHEAAASDSAKVLRLQSSLDAYDTKRKKQAGPCCVLSLRARRDIHVTSGGACVRDGRVERPA